MRPKTSEVLRRILLQYYSGQTRGICNLFVDVLRIQFEVPPLCVLYDNFFAIIRNRISIEERDVFIWECEEKYVHHRIRFVKLLIHHFESIGD